MKLAKRIASILLILAGLALGLRIMWTVSNGIEDAKDFFYGLVGKEVERPASDSYSNVDGYITQVKTAPVSGTQSILIKADAAIIKLRTGGSNDIVIEAKYEEKSFFAENIFSAEEKNGILQISFKQKKFGFSFGASSRKSEITISVPKGFKGSLGLEMNACSFDGESGSAQSLDLKVNAGSLNLRGISGSLNADMNACDSSFEVGAAAGNIKINANACKVSLKLPSRSNYRVSNSVTVGNVNNNYDDAVTRGGKEFTLELSGSATQIDLGVKK